MSEQDTFLSLPIMMDPQSKAIQPIGGGASASRSLQKELDNLNTLHRAILQMESPFPFPPPPVPVIPKRSAAVAKLRDTGNDLYRKQKYPDAAKHYSLGLQAALARPLWEPSQLCREEVATLYANKAQAEMAMRNWPQGAVDAECSVDAKRMGNAKAWWRRAKCLLEMGRLEEGRDWVIKGLELEAGERDLLELKKDFDARIAVADAQAYGVDVEKTSATT